MAMLANAATRLNENTIPAVQMSDNLTTKAAVEPLDGNLFLEVSAHINEYAEYLNAQGATISLTKVNQWLVLNKKYFTNKQLRILDDKLKAIDEDNYQNLMSIDYKDPTTALVLSVFLGGLGVDRFYIGNIGLGVGKLITAGGLGVWWLIDLFCIQNATKKANYKEIESFFAYL